ncbi:MAG TPA: alpha/beta hydrolase family protein [Verrucomicrobiae bacterium]
MLPQSMWREAANERDLKLEQAVQFLNGPDFIPAESQPAQLDFGPDARGGRFRFPTPRPCEFAENNVVHGRLYRCGDAWQERPVIVLLHGGGDFPGHQFGFHLLARRCNRAGFNAATLELPYHFQRRPRQYGPMGILCQYIPLISRDYLQMAKTWAQAVAEIRSLNGWLLAEGCPAVALVGASLGAYLAGLTGCRDARLGSIVLAMPGARMGLLPESLHGGGDFPGHQFGFHLFARRCNRAGFNAATLELPYHFQRRPRQYGPVSILCQYVPLISRDYLQMAKTWAQAVAEIRSLNGWLLAEGCPAVALVGVSLGAYLAGMTACRDARLASTVMIMPAARMGLLSSQFAPVRRRRVQEAILRRRAACEELDRTPLNLTSARPAISKENVLLIEGMHDLLASSSPVELWQSWGQPEIWRLSHGHISTALTALMPGLPNRVLRWLAPRLNAPDIRKGQTTISAR